MKVHRKKKILDFFVKQNYDLIYNDEALKINGLTRKYINKNGITEKQAIKKIREFANGSDLYLIGQNVKFDYDFLKALFDRHNEDMSFISWRLADTMVIGMFLTECGICNFKSFKLENMFFDVFGKEMKNAHTSLGDVLATEKLYNYFIKKVKKNE